MKLHHLLIPLGIIAIAVVAIGAYQANSAPLPKGFPAPTADGQIEVKSYPAYRSATYLATGELATAANRAFSPLYQHISSNEISMTAPVETRYPSSTIDAAGNERAIGEAQVSFLYRSTDIYPKEIADNIFVEDIPPMTVVSLGLVGSYSYESYQSGLARLNDWLKQNREYEIVGSPRRFFYDGPYMPDGLKRSEIQIPIRLVTGDS
jgi:SOUL heme-binding protein